MITLIASRSSDEQNEIRVLEPGIYQATIIRADHEVSKKGTPQLCLEVDIYNPVTGKPTMEKTWVPCTQKTVFRVEQLFAACGKVFGKGESISVDENWLRGKKCAVVTCIRKSEQGGRFLDIIRFLNPKDVDEFGPLSEDRREYYCINPDGTRGTREKGEAAAQPKQNAWLQAPVHHHPQAGNGPEVMPNEEDDDIPF